MCEYFSYLGSKVRRNAVVAGVALCLMPGAAMAQPAAPSMGGAESFAVLAGATVANTGTATIGGDVGVDAGGTVSGITAAMLAEGSSLHIGDAVAVQAHHAAVLAYQDLASRTCAPGGPNDLTGGTLGVAPNDALDPGVYCFGGDAPLSGTLTLNGTGPWIFQIGGALTVAAGSSILTPGLPVPGPTDPPACRGTSVYWQIGDDDPATLLADSSIDGAFVGNVLALGNVTVVSGATVDGRLVSLGELDGTTLDGGAVTMNGNTVNACSYGHPLPTSTSFKVTGGGSINVPNDPTETDPDATGNGFANYGFNAHPAAAGVPASGNFNYVNHAINGNLHLNGPVTDVDVLALNDDDTPKTVRFSGTCEQLLAGCTFSVMVQDNGEPGRNDQFGVTVAADGEVLEERAMRVVRNGNIQFHDATLETEVDDETLSPGQTMRLTARLRRSRTPAAADAYVALRMPNGQMMSWTGSALVPGLVPIARNFVPTNFVGEILNLRVPGGTPPGYYTWMSALTEAGTLNLLSGISERRFTVTP